MFGLGYIVIPYLDYPFWFKLSNSVYQISHDRNVTIPIRTSHFVCTAVSPRQDPLPHSGQGRRLAGIHSRWLVSPYCRYYVLSYFSVTLDDTDGL